MYNKTYYSAKLPASFGSVNKLVEATKGNRKNVLKWLKTQPTYTLHKPIKRRYKTRSYHVHGLGEQFQADLVEMIPWAKENNGMRYILTMIDVFSRKAC